MKSKYRFIMFYVLIIAMVYSVAIDSRAETKKKKINSVDIKISGNIEIDTKIGDEHLDITTKGERYNVEEYEIDNAVFRWSRDDIPVVKITLRAEDDYKFNTTKSEDIHVNGAEFVRAERKESSTILVVTVKFPALYKQVAPIKNIVMNSEGLLTWSASEGAGSYEIKLVRGAIPVGGVHSTTETSINLRNLMDREGDYVARIRAISSAESAYAGIWTDSNVVRISRAVADANRQIEEAKQSEGTWILDSEGYIFKLPDGTMPTSAWRLINSKWYYFNEKGYMATGWIQTNEKWYYLDMENGHMWANTTTPDGYKVDITGAYYR